MKTFCYTITYITEFWPFSLTYFLLFILTPIYNSLHCLNTNSHHEPFSTWISSFEKLLKATNVRPPTIPVISCIILFLYILLLMIPVLTASTTLPSWNSLYFWFFLHNTYNHSFFHSETFTEELLGIPYHARCKLRVYLPYPYVFCLAWLITLNRNVSQRSLPCSLLSASASFSPSEAPHPGDSRTISPALITDPYPHTLPTSKSEFVLPPWTSCTPNFPSAPGFYIFILYFVTFLQHF